MAHGLVLYAEKKTICGVMQHPDLTRTLHHLLKRHYIIRLARQQEQKAGVLLCALEN